MIAKHETKKDLLSMGWLL